jgi:peptide deformylase
MSEKILQIYKYGDDVLKLKAPKVTNIDEEIVKLIRLMTATLYYTTNGVGLAAPQVGTSLQLSVIDLSVGQKADEFMVLLNPEIIEAEGSEAGEEGCLSFPGMCMPVKRKTKLLLKYIDMEGKERQQDFDGFKARVIQHEVDHLDGILIIDRVSSLRRQMVKK